MSFGDFEYQETTSNQLARILKSMRQEQIILDAVQNPVDDIEEYPDARQVESIKGTKDHIGAVLSPLTKSWHFASEPNDTTKAWFWFREGWRLKDISRHGNNAFAQQVEPSPQPVLNYVPLRRRAEDDDATEGRLYGIIDGISQYYRIEDGPNNRASDLLEANNEICFSIFLSPWQTYQINEFGRIVLYSKLDNDQITDAVMVEATEQGAIHFKMIYKGSSYEINSANGTIPVTELSEYAEGEFVNGEFITNSSKPWQYSPDIEAPDWTWLFFCFNKIDRKLCIFKVTDGFMATMLVESATDETGIRTTFSMHLPMNEGGVDALGFYDISGNSNNATFGSAPNNDITWNGFVPRLDTNTARATIPNHATINTLSVFTIAFKARLQSYAATANEDIFLSKGYGGNADQSTGAADFKIHLLPSGSTTLRVTFQPNAGGVTQTIDKAAAFPTLNTWVNVILTYNGTTYSLEVDNLSAVTLAGSSHVFTSSEDWYIGDTLNAAQCDIAHLIIDKGTAWGSTQKNWFKNVLQPGYKAIALAWKPPKPPEPETPLPVVRPMEKVYDKVVAESGDTVKVNALQLTTPFVTTYSVPGGTPATVPEELKYDVADGTSGGGGTNPISTIYNLAAASSTGNIQEDETGYVQRIVDTNSVIYNKKPTDLQFWVNDSGGDCDGMVYPAIIRTNGTYTKLGAGISATGLTSTWTSISGVSYVDRTALAVGDGVGIVREGHSNGTLGVRRGGTDNHYDNAGGTIHSYQHLLDGTSFTTNNDDYSIAGVVKVGGETLPGTNPYFKMTSTQYVVGTYQLNSTLENIKPSKVIWRVRRVGSAASATLKCYILNSSGTAVATIGSAVNFNTISTTVQDLQFQDVNQAVQWADGYMVALAFDVKTGINTTTNYLEVNYNSGSTVGGTAIKARYFNGVSAYVDHSPAADWAGKIYVGGANFTSYIELDNLTTRVAEKVNQSVTPNISTLFDEKTSKFSPILKKSGSPTGNITVRMYDGTGAFVTTFDTVVDASSLTTTDTVYNFQKPGQNVPMGQGYRIAVHYEGGNATDKVLVKINTNALGGTDADGIKSILSTWTSGAWVDQDTLDISGTIYTGGIPDLTSRPRVAIECDSIFSQIYSDRITQAVIKAKKFGAPTGNFFFSTMRGSDNSIRDTLGSFNIASLSTTTWTPITLSNFNALHFMGEGDKFIVEYDGGDASNYLLLLVDKASTYDDEDTRYAEYDGLNWLDTNVTWDLAGELWTGGDTYIPDAGTPYVEPPDYYDHDGIIGAGSFVEGVFTSFYGMRIRDFRIETSVPTLEEMDNLFDNKYSRRGGKGEVALAGYSTMDSETEPPAA